LAVSFFPLARGLAIIDRKGILTGCPKS